MIELWNCACGMSPKISFREAVFSMIRAQFCRNRWQFIPRAVAEHRPLFSDA